MQNSQFYNGHSLEFLGIFFIFLIAGRNRDIEMQKLTYPCLLLPSAYTIMAKKIDALWFFLVLHHITYTRYNVTSHMGKAVLNGANLIFAFQSHAISTRDLKYKEKS